MKVKKNSFRIAITVLIIAFILSFYLFQISRDFGSINVSNTSSIEESKSVGVYKFEYLTMYSKSIDDSLKKFGFSFELNELKCWIEQGLEYKPMFFYYKVVLLDNYRLNYNNPAKNSMFLAQPQFNIAIQGYECKDLELFHDFSSIFMDSLKDTVNCKAYLFFDNHNENCYYIGDFLLVNADSENNDENKTKNNDIKKK